LESIELSGYRLIYLMGGNRYMDQIDRFFVNGI